LSAIFACIGSSSVMRVPGTLVAIVLKGPRYSLPISGFGSYESTCESPPGSHTMMTAVFSCAGLTAFSARSRSKPGSPSVAKPVSPMRMKPRRLKGP